MPSGWDGGAGSQWSMRHVYITSLLLSCWLHPGLCQAIKQLMYTNNERACNHKHFYESDSEFLVRADGEVTGSRCVLSFLEFQWSEKNLVTPCISLCIRITQYSLGSCDFKMIYSDGLGDPLPKKFDCHTFPPLLWCSTKNDIKIEFVELEKYKGEGYNITLEVKPICGAGTTHSSAYPSGESYKDRYHREEKKQRDTVIITGALVSTVSFLFVIFWIVYCCWKRKNTDGEVSTRGSGNTTSHTTAVKSLSTGAGSSGLSSNQGCKTYYPMHQSQAPTQGCGPPGYTERPHYEARYTEMPTSHKEKDIMTAPYYNRQSPAKDLRYDIDGGFRGHAYDADVELPMMPFPSHHPPPLPPRPNMMNPNSKQTYFV